MNDSAASRLSSIEHGITGALDDGRRLLSESYERCEEEVRRAPGPAVLLAFGAGYVASQLPLGALLAAPIRLATKLAPAALLALGVAKAAEWLAQSGRPVRRLIPLDEE